MHVRVYVLETVRLPVDSVPFTAFAPLHPLEAVQDVALVDVQERVAAVL